MEKQYTLNIPIIFEQLLQYDPEGFRRELIRVGADRVFLATGFYEMDPTARREKFDQLKKVIEMVRSWGFGVGVWTWTFAIKQKHPFTFMTDTDGVANEPFCCPADPAFKEFATDYIADIAKLGPDLILLDDDFRYPNTSLGCTCPHHRKLLNDAFGRTVEPKEIPTFFCGEKKQERQLFRKVIGQVLYDFAETVRRKIDAVNPKVRCGYCSSGTCWYLDGTEATELARRLAGNTEPFMRLHAAPYWSSEYGFFFRPAVVNENSRMQAAWACQKFTDILAEGDVWPRPRYQSPAAYLEAFDTVMCMDGNCGGIMKYSFDYTADVGVETGYNDLHVRHMPVCKRIKEEIAALPSVGVRAYEFRDKLDDAVLSDEYTFYGKLLEYDRRAHAGILLQDNNIPTTYTGTGMPGIVFGANAWKLPLERLEDGLILDAPAAQILQQRGIDVGLRSAALGLDPKEELFESGARSKIWDTKGLYEIVPDEKATVASHYIWGSDYQKEVGSKEEKEYPAAYSYENANGQRFFVLAFDGTECHKSAYRFYDKSYQLYKAAAFVGRKPLPIECSGHPDLYVLCKQDEHTLAVGLWNNFPDDIPNPVVNIAEEWKNIDFVQGNGRYENGKVYLDGMAPYSFCIFLLKR